MSASDRAQTGRLSRYRRVFFESDSTERTVFFSDAVFAIAMTLLVLEIDIPGPDQVASGELGAALAERWYEFFGYVLSFVLLGNLWLSHHHVWQLVRRVAPPVQVLNLLMLLFVAFIPVPTSLIAQWGPQSPVAPIGYALSIAAVELALLASFVAARRRGLLEPFVETDLYLMVRRQLLVPPLVFLASCVVALAWPLGGMLSWLLLWPVFLLSNLQVRRRLRRHDREDAQSAEASPGRLSPGQASTG